MGTDSVFRAVCEKWLSVPEFAQTRQKAVQALQDVLSNPYHGKKLPWRANRFSVRLGRDHRLVYSVYSHQRLVDFEFVGDRKEAYRWIRHV